MAIDPAISRYNLLGVHISAINMKQALETIQGWIDQGKKEYVCVVPAHSIMDANQQVELQPIFNQAGMCTPDGMGVVWSLKLAGFRNVSRVYGPDLMLAVSEYSVAKNWSHFYFGGTSGVLDNLVGLLQSRFSGLRVAGVFCPPFRQLTPAEDSQVIEQINASGAEIVWIGIGSPKQEQWMADHRAELNAPVLIGVGAAFDFLSGAKSQAPRWIQRSGLEWLYRFAQEPRRLWKRYIQYPRFVWLVMAQLLGIGRYSEISDGKSGYNRDTEAKQR
jgi:N-acetylglucosaminyldiphosphoundecaprenol N-acetyl-beta-D-mannosaminyltransferase